MARRSAGRNPRSSRRRFGNSTATRRSDRSRSCAVRRCRRRASGWSRRGRGASDGGSRHSRRALVETARPRGKRRGPAVSASRRQAPPAIRDGGERRRRASARARCARARGVSRHDAGKRLRWTRLSSAGSIGERARRSRSWQRGRTSQTARLDERRRCSARASRANPSGGARGGARSTGDRAAACDSVAPTA